MHALVDADSILYRAAIENEIRIEHPDTDWISIGFREGDLSTTCSAILSQWLMTASEYLPIDKVTLCFTDSRRNPVGPRHTNFRKKLYSPYKENRQRSGVGKPHGFYHMLEKWYNDTDHKTLIWPGLEADDICGIMQTYSPNGTVILSIDKDMRTIPGMLVNPDTDRVFETSEREAEENHMIQTLSGDSTDNYPGLPGIGPVGARKLVRADTTWRDLMEHWNDVSVKLLEKGKSTTNMLTQARMAKILTNLEWDAKNERVIPWEFPSE